MKTIKSKKEDSKENRTTQSPLTPGQLRAHPGLKELTDEQAEDSLRTLQELAAIVFSIFNNMSHE